MMPAQYVNMWLNFTRSPVVKPGSNCATKLWWDVSGGDLDWLVGFDVDNAMDQLCVDMCRNFVHSLPSSWFTLFGNVEFKTATQHRTVLGVANIQGALSAFTIAPALSACAMKRTNKPGPNGVGRLYFPDVPKSFIVNAFIDSIGVASYQSTANLLLAPWSWGTAHGTITLRPCLHSLQDNDLTPIQRFDILTTPRYLYRRRIRT